MQEIVSELTSHRLEHERLLHRGGLLANIHNHSSYGRTGPKATLANIHYHSSCGRIVTASLIGSVSLLVFPFTLFCTCLLKKKTPHRFKAKNRWALRGWPQRGFVCLFFVISCPRSQTLSDVILGCRPCVLMRRPCVLMWFTQCDHYCALFERRKARNSSLLRERIVT